MQSIPGLVSIVIPCFNAGHTLRETVESARAAPDCEVVLVDDGSTDPHTLQVIEGLPEDVVLVRQANRGLPAARNAGIARARGEFILPLDADDLIEKEYPGEARAVLQAHPEVGIVYCRADFFGAKTGVWDLPDYTIERMLVDNVIFCAALFRKSDWTQVGGYDEQMRRGREDHHFWLRLISAGREVVRLDGLYFHYRISDGSMNTGYARDDFIEIFSRIFRDNADLYVANIEAVIRHRFELTDRVNDLQHRYRFFEQFIDRHPAIYAVARRSRRVVRGMRGRAGH